MKYVRFKHPTLGEIYRCGLHCTHADIANEVQAKSPAHVPFSAGFMRFVPGGIQTFGQSTSLKLVPDPSDATILTKLYLLCLTEGGGKPSTSRHPFL